MQLTMGIAGIVIAFIKAWDLALVACITSPLVVFGIYYLTVVTGTVRCVCEYVGGWVVYG